jgi:hypothetical protein
MSCDSILNTPLNILVHHHNLSMISSSSESLKSPTQIFFRPLASPFLKTLLITTKIEWQHWFNMEKPHPHYEDENTTSTSFKLQLGGKVFYDRRGSMKHLWSTIGAWVELEKNSANNFFFISSYFFFFCYIFNSSSFIAYIYSSNFFLVIFFTFFSC